MCGNNAVTARPAELCFESKQKVFGMEKHVNVVLNIEALLKVHSAGRKIGTCARPTKKKEKKRTFPPLYTFSSVENKRVLNYKRF